ncbi:hypothetical protein SAY86_017925 [Trapa natans]|uniref:Poly(A) RNA polymerase mitochondrial-like central palm domain-containing protein n=1 Tax=Trapa natans TaxID=22666 RepID=A0AAN7R7W6_TRANT|nr:hypothetical protein SAY86_017925 [Trapa natans]
MNTKRTLDLIISDILAVVKPKQSDWAIRFQIIDELRRVVESVESLRGATVEPFGSFVSNLFTTSGDLDISIHLSLSAYITFSGKNHKQKLLGDLLAALRNGGWCKLQFIQHAKIPILKFESKYKRISCDVSVDNLKGQIKSKFLLWLGKIDERFRDLVLLVKEWAKSHDINNPKHGTLNSYTLSLLVIFHFQTCSPPIFPPLSNIYHGNAADHLTGIRADAERHIAETCAANIDRFISNRSGPINGSSLSELFITFLAKFSGIASKAVEFGICPYTGRWERLCNNTRWMPKTYTMFVEDPFDQPENTAKSVNSRKLIQISEAFEFSYNTLISANQSPSYLLSLVATPQVVRHLTRPPRDEHQSGNRPPASGGLRLAHPMKQQSQKVGSQSSASMSSNKVTNHKFMQQDLRGSSMQKYREIRPARNGIKPQQTRKQEHPPPPPNKT